MMCIFMYLFGWDTPTPCPQRAGQPGMEPTPRALEAGSQPLDHQDGPDVLLFFS